MPLSGAVKGEDMRPHHALGISTRKMRSPWEMADNGVELPDGLEYFGVINKSTIETN